MTILLEKMLYWSKESSELENEMLTFQFCYFDNCNIIEIDVQEIRFIGCIFDGGYIANSTIKKLDFIGCCMKNTNNPLDLSLADVECINDVYSRIEYIDKSATYHKTNTGKQITGISRLIDENVYDAENFLEEFEMLIIRDKYYNHLIIIGCALLNIFYSVRRQALQLMIKYYPFLSSDYKDWIMEGIVSQLGNEEVFPHYQEVINRLQPNNYLFKASFDRIYSQNANSIIESLRCTKTALLYQPALKTLVDVSNMGLLKNHYNEEISKLCEDILRLVKA